MSFTHLVNKITKWVLLKIKLKIYYMAKLIAREDYALKVGHGSCSSYSASRAVTRARAVSYGASISGSYSDN